MFSHKPFPKLFDSPQKQDIHSQFLRALEVKILPYNASSIVVLGAKGFHSRTRAHQRVRCCSCDTLETALQDATGKPSQENFNESKSCCSGGESEEAEIR